MEAEEQAQKDFKESRHKKEEKRGEAGYVEEGGTVHLLSPVSE